MTNEELTIELLAQTLAPKLFNLFGTPPEEMGFPIYDSKEEVAVHLKRQFEPVEYWTEEGRKIAMSVFNIVKAGGLTFPDLDIDVMCKAAAKERPDMADHQEP